MFSKRLLSVLAVAVAMSAVVAAPASANHTWGSYHWARTANPFTLSVGDNVSAAWDSYLGVVSGDWSSQAQDGSLDSVLGITIRNPVRPQVVGGSTDPKKCRPKAGRIEVCDATYGRNGWLGLASIWASGSHITQATTKLNDSYFNSGTYNTPDWRAMVSCQEVGHDFGLDHQDETFANTNLGTCMDYTNQPAGGGSYGPSNEQPNTHDYGELTAIYQHLNDGTTTIAASPASSGNGLRAVRDDLYIEDLGNGNRRIVFVFWSQRVPHGPPADA